MFKQLVSCTGLAILLLTTGVARADEASVRKAVEAWMGGKVDGVKKTSLLGLYEIQSGNEIYYTDEKVSLSLRSAGNVRHARGLKRSLNRLASKAQLL
mgnify:CR=1 FL=1